MTSLCSWEHRLITTNLLRLLTRAMPSRGWLRIKKSLQFRPSHASPTRSLHICGLYHMGPSSLLEAGPRDASSLDPFDLGDNQFLTTIGILVFKRNRRRGSNRHLPR